MYNKFWDILFIGGGSILLCGGVITIIIAIFKGVDTNLTGWLMVIVGLLMLNVAK